jgi:hypothetical protein
VSLTALPAGFVPIGAITAAGWLLGVIAVDPVAVGPGATLTVGFVAEPAI